ncbi:MAG TPA: hypothetical protein VGQ98_09525 [Gemmatimonadaceae bacterium]|nr:hypothetical protein [Gemmatimonadaceae bacterium]
MSTNRPNTGFDPDAAADGGVLEEVGVPDSVLTQPRNARQRARSDERRLKRERAGRILGVVGGRKKNYN